MRNVRWRALEQFSNFDLLTIAVSNLSILDICGGPGYAYGYMGKNIQEWTKHNLLKIIVHKFYLVHS